jgi:cytochrome c peroxidase
MPANRTARALPRSLIIGGGVALLLTDSPPYLHDGRLMTLADTVEFFNLVTGVELTAREKEAVVAFLMTL